MMSRPYQANMKKRKAEEDVEMTPGTERRRRKRRG
jgi:hypothetical protein